MARVAFGGSIDSKKYNLGNTAKALADFNIEDTTVTTPTVTPTTPRGGGALAGSAIEDVQAPAAALATPAVAPDQVVEPGGWFGPEAAPAQEGAPAAATPGQPSWVNPFIAAAGAMAQHFAQTAGQLSSGRMLTSYGMQQMEQAKKDSAAKLAGYDSEDYMKAMLAKAQIGLAEKQGVTEEARPGLMQSEVEKNQALAKSTNEHIKLVMPEIERIKQTTKNLSTENDHRKMEIFNNTLSPMINPLGDGKDYMVKNGEQSKFALEIPKVLAEMEHLKSLGWENEAIEKMKGQTIKVGGLDVPVTMLKTVMPAFVEQMRAASAENVANINKNAMVSMHNATIAGTQTEKDLEGRRAIDAAFQKEFMQPVNGPMLYSKDSKGKQIANPNAMYTWKNYVNNGIGLTKSPMPQDQLRGAAIISQGIDLGIVTPEDIEAIKRGAVPGAGSPAGSALATPTPAQKMFPAPLPTKNIQQPPNTGLPYALSLTGENPVSWPVKSKVFPPRMP